MEDSLRARIDRPGGSGPQTPNHLMYQDWASTRSIWLLTAYVALTVGLSLRYGSEAFHALMRTGLPREDFEAWMLQLVLACGAVGGVLQLCNSLGAFVGARKFLRSWLLFYYLRPLVGAGLGFITYLVLRMGVLGAAGGAANGNGAGQPDFNIFGIMAFTALAGLFSRQALEKLAEIFEVMFQKVKEDVEKADTTDLFLNRGRTADDFSQRLPASLPPAQEQFGTEETTRE